MHRPLLLIVKIKVTDPVLLELQYAIAKTMKCTIIICPISRGCCPLTRCTYEVRIYYILSSTISNLHLVGTWLCSPTLTTQGRTHLYICIWHHIKQSCLLESTNVMQLHGDAWLLNTEEGLMAEKKILAIVTLWGLLSIARYVTCARRPCWIFAWCFLTNCQLLCRRIGYCNCHSLKLGKRFHWRNSIEPM